MQTTPPWKALTFGSVAAWAVSAASAAGLGGGAASAVLGQPLDYPVQVRLDAGESLAPECVAAEVTAGDRRVPPSLVRTVLEMTGTDTARVRVQTQQAIDEPVVGVTLTVGCNAKISRRYVVLADPPLNAMATAPAFAANPPPVPEPAPGAPAAPASAPRAMPDTPPVAPVAQGSAPAEAAPQRAARAPRVPRAADGTASTAGRDRSAQAQARRERAAARQAQRAAAAAPAPVARLKLDAAPPPPAPEAAAVEAAMAAVAEAASAARAAASAASASAERIASLERTVESLRAEAKASKDLAAQLRVRLVDAEKGSAWMLPLMAVAGLLAVLSAWLAWRLGRAQAVRQEGWREALAPQVAQPVSPPPPSTMSPATEASPSRQPTAPIPFVTSELRPAPKAAARVPRANPAWPPPAPAVAWPPPDSLPPTIEHEPVPPTQRTEALPAGARTDEDQPRDVSIEELIDLEQQADFFVVLGQDEAAIDLLVEHVRSTGGGSPLPYLKLLEIHHRRNDREAYERIRGRFNHRFNAYAPEWGVDLTHGRSLDDYAGVIPRLQQVWPRPLDAMAELEALLFRKSRGELFDLPAYREVLFLYSLARDLLDRAAADSGNVDLLLPLADGTEFGATSPSPFTGLERDAFRDTMAPDDRPTAPLDFDVTGAERPTSIFDLLDDKTQPGMRRPGS